MMIGNLPDLPLGIDITFPVVSIWNWFATM